MAPWRSFSSSLQFYPVKIWLINLERDHSRLSWMTDQLNAVDAPFERFDALTPEAFTEDQRRYATAPGRTQMRPAEIACLLSHIGVWRGIATGPAEGALILEDDIHLSADFPRFWQSLALDPSEICIHRLETLLARVTVERTASFRCGSRRAHKLLSNHGGGAAYILNRATARELLMRVDLFQNNVDVELFDPARGAASSIATYQWIPALCIQDDFMGIGAKGCASNILERADIDSGVYTNARREPFKDALRPLYTMAYDLVLAPFGRSRKLVPFR